MNIGKLDKRITLQKPNLISDSGGGRKSPPGENKWVDVATVWAEFKDPKFETKEVAGAISSVSLREIKIRYFPDVIKGWRIIYDTETMPIGHTYHKNRAETFLVCKEVVK